MCGQQKLQRGVHASNSMVVIGAREPVSNPVSGGYSIYDVIIGERAKRAKPHTNWSKWKIAIFIMLHHRYKRFTGLETDHVLSLATNNHR